MTRGLTKKQKAAVPKPEGPMHPLRCSQTVSNDRLATCKACKHRTGTIITKTRVTQLDSGGYDSRSRYNVKIACEKLDVPINTIVDMYLPHCPADKWKD